MGLLKAAVGSVGGVLADQWKEFFYCDSMAPDVLMTKGQKRLSSEGRAPIPRRRTMSFPTGPSLPSTTGSAS